MSSVIGVDDGSGYGVLGTGEAAPGVIGRSRSGPGVHGRSIFADGIEAESGAGRGVFGHSKQGDAVVGHGELGRGVFGHSQSAIGVYGESEQDNGVFGQTDASARAGVFGHNRGTDAGTGTVGLSDGIGGIGVFGSAPSRGTGVVGSGSTGMIAQGEAGPGVEASSRQQNGVNASAENNGFAGVLGRHTAGGPGVRGEASNGSGVEGMGRPGVLGLAEGNYSTGVLGQAEGDFSSGVVGRSGNPPAWLGVSPAGVVGQASGASAIGVMGQADGVSGVGVEGQGPVGVFGIADTIGPGAAGVWGRAPDDGVGVVGVSSSSDGIGVRGMVDGDGIGVWGGTSGNGTGIFGYSDHPKNLGSLGWAARFAGAVNVTGPVYKSGGGFLIDHPLDPANRYLSHAFVESDAMRNLYDGVTELDADGAATVVLPSWFGALNGSDLRYQLTAIGTPSPDLHVRRELKDDRFEIAGGSPSGKVCWQVAGVRRDVWALANAVPTEFDKSDRERGLYRHPELYGLPDDKGINGRLVQSAKDLATGIRSNTEQRSEALERARLQSTTVLPTPP
jgi:hypothetical protein